MIDSENEVDAVISDSGSDANVLPRVYASDNISARKHRLRKCEGTPLKTYGTRETEWVVTTLNGEEVVLKQQFVVGEVTGCLLGQVAYWVLDSYSRQDGHWFIEEIMVNDLHNGHQNEV